ncbi:fatty acyl-CoA synthetase [Rhodococcus koreensis]|uniref:fatty acyl-CoA synthetase n=1 Tax=Rhodococcus koreensis TaxID=99653 RepID=UPI0019820A1D|nr:fatty acyl-CoA synthetase [Rhodococcus koreensis]QSE86639.1 long-chain-fatty-acid--CoA ligase [Rhodococcus koreensis]
MSAPEVVQARGHALADLLHRSAARYPGKTALIGSDRSFDFRELHAAVDRTAAALARRGLAHGDRLAILSRNNWQYVVVTYAAARLGVVLVPINFMLKAEEVAYILDHSGAQGVITEADLQPLAAKALAELGLTLSVQATIGELEDAAGWDNFTTWVDEPGSAPHVLVADDDPVRIMYTSGTESRPKGALLSSRALISEYVSCIVDGGMAADDIDLHTLPLYHCAQMDCFLGPDVYLGATSIVLPGPDPAAVLAAIETHKVTKFFAPPTVWISLLRAPEFETSDLSSLRKGYYGASAMPVEVLREIRTRLPQVQLWNFYGQTELSPVATILGPHEQESHAGSAGRPVLNVETVVVDDDDRQVPPGTVGEIVHRSPQATLGYWRDEAKTTEAFRNGWFHSGDLGVFDDEGRLTVVDRKKDMIKTGGENVASREVEEAIYLHPDVAEVAVFAVPHPKWVEAVCAVVVPRPGADLDEATVLAHCATRLAGFKVPKHLVVADSLPKNPSGKILKRDLRTTFADLAHKEN